MDWIIEQRLRKQVRNTPTDSPSPLLDLTRAEEVAAQLLARAEMSDAEISILLTDDPGIHALNLQWRNIDKPTDVLSWPQEEFGDAPVLGEAPPTPNNGGARGDSATASATANSAPPIIGGAELAVAEAVALSPLAPPLLGVGRASPNSS